MLVYTDKITRKLVEWKHQPLPADNIPAHSSVAIINCVFESHLLLC